MTDESGMFILGSLPYSDTFIKTFMPADVLKRHQGGAVNTANKITK